MRFRCFLFAPLAYFSIVSTSFAEQCSATLSVVGSGCVSFGGNPIYVGDECMVGIEKGYCVNLFDVDQPSAATPEDPNDGMGIPCVCAGDPHIPVDADAGEASEPGDF